MQEELKKLLDNLYQFEPMLCQLTKAEQVGYVFSMRWSALSKISGAYSNEEILKKIREYYGN